MIEKSDTSISRTQWAFTRNPRMAYSLALVGGLLVVALEVVWPFIFRPRFFRFDLTHPNFYKFDSIPLAIPLAVWMVLLVCVTWYDDNALGGWISWWFIAILDIYFGVLDGWYARSPPRSFDVGFFVFGLVTRFIPALLVYLVIRWAIVGLLNQLRHFLRSDECQRCGYSLHGLESHRCPECGSPFDPSRIKEGAETSSEDTGVS